MPPLATSLSLRSHDYPDRYIRHRGFKLWPDPLDYESRLFLAGATFGPVPPLAGL
jgi:hypothetical protein